MATYYLWNIGCQMNKAESEQLCAYLEGLGYSQVARPQDADLALMNTCVVRGSAEERVAGELGYLSGLKKRSARLAIAMTGCFVDSDVRALRERFPQVDLAFPAGDFETFVSWMSGRVGAKATQARAGAARERRATAYVPVIRGCDNFCAYCIVPYRRGREHSRPVDEIVCEVQSLARRGVKELTLLGQNINSYGRDLPGKSRLADLLSSVHSVPGLERLRFLTSHPRDVDDEFVAVLARLDKVCEWISLPVQAGDDRILQAMRRGYTAEHYRRLVGILRDRVPGIAISTDVIVGFPGETTAEFDNTLRLVAELRFDTVHVASYSPRPGTLASRTMPDDVPHEEKARRLRLIEGLQESIATEINGSLVGTRVEVLVEGKNRDKWEGRTRSNKLVFFADAADRTGQLVSVEITGASPWSLQGRLFAADRAVAV